MNILVYGAGAMGKLVAAALKEDDRFKCLGMIDSRAEISSEGIYRSPQEIAEPIQGIIDFSHPSSLDEILKLASQGIPALIATTGFSPEEIEKIKKASENSPIIFTYNTSLGVNLLGELVHAAAKALNENFDIEIIEKHHNKKLDSPSGTAKLLFEKIKEGVTSSLTPIFGRQGMKKREKNDVGIHAVRGGTIVGEHSVVFAGTDEIIEINHEALSKSIFAKGALRGMAYLQGKSNGLYTMKDVLGL